FSSMDILFIVLQSIPGYLGMIGNVALLAALKYRAPRSWKSYTILLVNCALIDLLACCSSAVSVERYVPFKDVTTSVFIGPCTLVSGFFCHVLHC
ncbi:hypothetical protein PMAYCL1PPCAC_22961, partial [Pristionchus mayeri]